MADFYSVLGLEKGCSVPELKNAYKKLALRWHPDRCSASGNSKFVEEAKRKFQAIQEAYSVLSDHNKRFLYDIGIHESDGDEEDGMCDFMEEMAVLMGQTKATNEKRGEESFEELQELFNEMFNRDMCASEQSSTSSSSSSSSSSNTVNSSKMYNNNNNNNGTQRNCSGSARSGKAKDKLNFESTSVPTFWTDGLEEGGSAKKRRRTKEESRQQQQQHQHQHQQQSGSSREPRISAMDSSARVVKNGPHRCGGHMQLSTMYDCGP
ncbi:hypothetical protein Scep_008026 [Stephania cephalantha]|uniref:J domain-containing protein n=1 Tax=Stephania cephalantha TaxID=152367 RepID=A0AAP0KCW3_9MAGN